MTRPPELIGSRFVLGRVVGIGGMGQVFEAEDRVGGGRVAVKLMHGRSAVERRRFAREAAALSRVSHPALVGYVDHGELPDGRCFLVMEWLEGEDLAARLRRAPLEVPEVLTLARRVTGALVAMHAEGAIHRDLKPSNLYLPDRDPARAKVLDLGIARLSETRFDLTAMTAPGALIGTPAYVSPEQARGHHVDARTDLYSLGVVLWECLAEQRAFAGDDVMAVLARVLFDPIPSLAERVAGLPLELAELIDRLTDKEPDARPASAADVLAVLEAVQADGVPGRLTRGRLSVMTPMELRVVTVVVITPGDVDDLASGETWLPGDAADALADVRPLAEPYGLRVEAFPDGTLIALVDGTRGPIDGAVRIARFARAVLARTAGSEIVICTDKVLADALPVGAAVERASELLVQTAPGEIRLDPASAELLRGSFRVGELDGVLRLSEPLPTTRARSLPPSQCFGRRRELAWLQATLEECASEPCARAALVSGEAGMGKTRLVDEALRGAEGFIVLRGRGDPVRQSSAYAVLSPMLQVSLGVDQATSLETARAAIEARVSTFGPDAPRVAAMLGELAGVPFDEARVEGLRAIREDPRALADLVRASFIEYLAALSLERPTAIVLDDLQWADRASVALIDASLRALEEHPIAVLVLGREGVDERFPRLFEGRDLARLTLAPLSRKATERLAASVGAELSSEAVREVAARAQGNPYFVEELARAAARGDSLPPTVLASVQARLDALAPDARLVLRAASVLGTRFPAAAVEALVGAQRALDVPSWLQSLAHAGFVDAVEGTGPALEELFVFRHVLVRDACYAMLTPEDRRRGHRNAARWLEKHGAPDPVSLAHHYEIAGEHRAAAGPRLAAAQRALAANDLEGVLAHVALIEDAEADVAARARVVEAEACIWRGDKARACEAAREALAALEPGSAPWMDAVGVFLDAAGGVGHAAEASDRVEDLLALSPDEPEQTRHLARALARCCTPLLFLDRSDLASRVATRAAKLAISLGSMDAMLSARLAENRAMAATAGGDAVSAVEAFETAARFYEQAGAARWAASTRVNLASKLLELGDGAAAAERAQAAIEYADRVGERYTSAFGRLVLGLARFLEGAPGEALVIQREAAERLAAIGDARLESASRAAIAEALGALGHAHAALEEIRRAVALVEGAVAPRAAALTVEAHLWLARGEPKRALEVVQRARVLADVEPMLDRELDLVWAHARALAELGQGEEAGRRARQAYAKVEANAARIEDPERRKVFLDGVPAHRGLRALLGSA